MYPPRHPSSRYLLGALLEQGAPQDWAEKTSEAYGSVLLRGDEQKTTQLQLALSALFREKGFHEAAAAILARPSDRHTYEQTGSAHASTS